MTDKAALYALKARIAALEAGIALAEAEMETKGGAGSGNWGHAGRKGKRGGSMSRGVAMSRTSGRDWQKRQISKKYGSATSSKFLDDLNSKKTPLSQKFAMVESQMKGKFADWKPARTATEVPVMDRWDMTVGDFSSKGKLSLFEENGGISYAPVLRGNDGKFYTGAMGNIREVKPVLDNKAIRQSLGYRGNKQLGAFKKQGTNGLDLTEVPGVVRKNKNGMAITKVGAKSFNNLVREGLVTQTSLIGPSGQGRYKLTSLGQQIAGN